MNSEEEILKGNCEKFYPKGIIVTIAELAKERPKKNSFPLDDSFFSVQPPLFRVKYYTNNDLFMRNIFLEKPPSWNAFTTPEPISDDIYFTMALLTK